MNLLLFFLSLFSLIGGTLLGGLKRAFLHLGRIEVQKYLERRKRGARLFTYTLRSFCEEEQVEELFSAPSFTKHLLQFLYVFLSTFTLLSTSSFSQAIEKGQITLLPSLYIALIAISIYLFALFLTNLFAIKSSPLYIKVFSSIVSLYIFLLFPLTWPLMKLSSIVLPKKKRDQKEMQKKILELLHSPEIKEYIDAPNRNLLRSVASFSERMAKEVMIPRVDLFALKSTTTIEDAAKELLLEGYSRIPLYDESIDNITGVLYQKDLFNTYIEHPDQLQKPVSSLLKPILYTPETKKISHLLQEFRSKQSHAAIVVDEYGGTEGIITIEDILEELVGEIEDEYDLPEEILFKKLPSGEFVVDAKMTLIDIADELKIEIPQSPDYETIGGFIFQKAGTIPSAGWTLHADTFDLKVLSSSDRAIEKVQLSPKSS